MLTTEQGIAIGIPIGVAIFTIFLTRWYQEESRKRQEIVDMSKFRMMKISKKAKSYVDLQRYSLVLSFQLGRIRNNTDLLNDYQFLASTFYYMIKFLKATNRIVLIEDSIILGNVDAETVVTELDNLVYVAFGRIYGSIVLQDVVKIITDDATLDNLDTIIRNDAMALSYYNRFCQWLRDQRNHPIIDILSVRLLCLSDLLIYELNVVFERWYDEVFYISEHLRPQSTDFIRNMAMFEDEEDNPRRMIDVFPRYYNRLFQTRLRRRRFFESRSAL